MSEAEVNRQAAAMKQPEMETVYIIMMRYDGQGNHGYWETTDYDAFKNTVDKIRVNFGKNAFITVGDENQPENGMALIHMKAVIGVDARKVERFKQPQALGEVSLQINAVSDAPAPAPEPAKVEPAVEGAASGEPTNGKETPPKQGFNPPAPTQAKSTATQKAAGQR